MKSNVDSRLVRIMGERQILRMVLRALDAPPAEIETVTRRVTREGDASRIVGIARDLLERERFGAEKTRKVVDMVSRDLAPGGAGLFRH